MRLDSVLVEWVEAESVHIAERAVIQWLSQEVKS